MSKLRAFIAIDLSDEVVSGAVELARKLAPSAPGVKWVERENLHLTLKFLGDVKENETWKICQAIQKSVANLPTFDVQFQGAGAFPKLQRPRTLWIGAGEGSKSLSELYNAIDDAMADLGFARDPKRFLPHLTIGRVKQPGPWLRDVSQIIEEYSELDIGYATVEEVVLYSSELTSDGPIYSPIGRGELASS